MELEETDAKGTENGSVRESPESIPLKSMLEIEEFKLEAPSEELPETQAEDVSEQNELLVDSKDQDREKGAVDTPEKILSGAGHFLIVVDSDSDDDDCVLLEDTIDEFPKPMKMQETAGNSKPGISLDIYNDLSDEKIDIPEPIASVIQMGSETQENGKIEEAGPWNSKIIEEKLIEGSIQEINWKDLSEKQLVLEPQESFITDELEHVENAQEQPEPKAEDGLVRAESSLNLSDSARSESAGSGNEPTASTSGFLDSLPGPSKSLNDDVRKLKASQKRKIRIKVKKQAPISQNQMKIQIHR
jgi:hypothetical protein